MCSRAEQREQVNAAGVCGHTGDVYYVARQAYVCMLDSLGCKISPLRATITCCCVCGEAGELSCGL